MASINFAVKGVQQAQSVTPVLPASRRPGTPLVVHHLIDQRFGVPGGSCDTLAKAGRSG
jgi:hypothetical protein